MRPLEGESPSCLLSLLISAFIRLGACSHGSVALFYLTLLTRQQQSGSFWKHTKRHQIFMSNKKRKCRNGRQERQTETFPTPLS